MNLTTAILKLTPRSVYSTVNLTTTICQHMNCPGCPDELDCRRVDLLAFLIGMNKVRKPGTDLRSYGDRILLATFLEDLNMIEYELEKLLSDWIWSKIPGPRSFDYESF